MNPDSWVRLAPVKRVVALALVLVPLVLVAAFFALRSGPEPEIIMDWGLDSGCVDGVIIGVAGSGQGDDVLGVGPQVASAVTGFTEQVTAQATTDVSAGFIALDYPALGVIEGGLFGFLGDSMFDSVAEGREELGSLVSDIAERCQGTSVYIVGYSQGASVVREFIDDLSAAGREPIAGIAVLADPYRQADDPNAEHFTTELDPEEAERAAPHTRDGVFGGSPVPDWLDGSFLSACARRDAVCNFAFTDLLAAERYHTEDTYNGLGPQLGELLADDLLARL